MKFSKLLQQLLFLSSFSYLFCQTITFPYNGSPDHRHTLIALTGLTVYQDYKTIVKNATILIKDGMIVECGSGITIPSHAMHIRLDGLTAYPSFIDLYSHTNIDFPEKWLSRPATAWNPAVLSHENAMDYLKWNEEKNTEYRKAGFGLVLGSLPQGIFRGTGVLYFTHQQIPNLSVFKEKAAQILSFFKGKSPEAYPSSLTGAIALIRQTFYDANWYATSDKKEKNISLEALHQNKNLPVVFDAGDKWNIFRAYEIAKEFSSDFIYKTSGNEYQRIHELAPLGLKYIVPLQFPEQPVIKDPLDNLNYSLPELMHWEMAPYNPAILEHWNQQFCLTFHGMKDSEEFLKNLRKAIQHGLSHQEALKALTYQPASFLRMENSIGAIKKGYVANFFISNGTISEDNFKIIQHWIQGIPFLLDHATLPSTPVEFPFEWKNKKFKLYYSFPDYTLKMELRQDTQKTDIQYKITGSTISFHFKHEKSKITQGLLHISSEKVPQIMALQDESGKTYWFPVVTSATKEPIKEKESKKDSIVPLTNLRLLYPFSSYGFTIQVNDKKISDFRNFISASSPILIRNATLWTNEKDSILPDADLLIENKKISKIGKNIAPPPGARIIDAKGKHVTPGIIDEHSHIAITGGVNEGTQASTAEVRMGDVINPDDVNIFRNLAGGVTAVQLLHGSANPIGGQSALIKLRWGCNIQDMKIENAPGFIKFALGENVKQSNWGDQHIWRFPQTRMGVEQTFTDHFIRAKEYAKNKKEYLSNPKTKAIGNSFRIDLEMEALAEILEEKRYITCHSYVQSEINMLMKVADSLKFKVNTFTHILEGYKVADKMKKHGANASTFSDWWAYKNEVMEAIPYNAALLTRVGVNTAINSDDAEMSRRLNHEAAKAIRYGRLTPVQALKLVTLNPAKMLHLDHRMGSIKPGMDADVVIWSGPPLSVYSFVEKTIVDGTIYYDKEALDSKKEWIDSEKQRIIHNILQKSDNSSSPPSFRKKIRRLYHCNTVEWQDDDELEHIR